MTYLDGNECHWRRCPSGAKLIESEWELRDCFYAVRFGGLSIVGCSHECCGQITAAQQYDDGVGGLLHITLQFEWREYSAMADSRAIDADIVSTLVGRRGYVVRDGHQ